MKIEVDDEQMIGMIVRKFARTTDFRQELSKIIHDEVKSAGNEFFNAGYKQRIKDEEKEREDVSNGEQ